MLRKVEVREEASSMTGEVSRSGILALMLLNDEASY